MTHSSVLVKADGDLVGEASVRFKSQLLEALQSNLSEVIVDLARARVINGQGVAAVLMARNSAEAAGRTLKVRLGRSRQAGFAKITGIDAVLIEDTSGTQCDGY